MKILKKTRRSETEPPFVFQICQSLYVPCPPCLPNSPWRSAQLFAELPPPYISTAPSAPSLLLRFVTARRCFDRELSLLPLLSSQRNLLFAPPTSFITSLFLTAIGASLSGVTCLLLRFSIFTNYRSSLYLQFLFFFEFSIFSQAPTRNHPLLLLSGVGTNAIGYDLSPGVCCSLHVSLRF